MELACFSCLKGEPAVTFSKRQLKMNLKMCKTCVSKMEHASTPEEKLHATDVKNRIWRHRLSQQQETGTKFKPRGASAVEAAPRLGKREREAGHEAVRAFIDRFHLNGRSKPLALLRAEEQARISSAFGNARAVGDELGVAKAVSAQRALQHAALGMAKLHVIYPHQEAWWSAEDQLEDIISTLLERTELRTGVLLLRFLNRGTMCTRPVHSLVRPG